MNKKSIFIPSLLFFASVLTFVITASAANNEITGFRYQSCKIDKCFVVESPKGWLSVANGAFVASGDKAETGKATLKLMKNGKMTNEFRGDEVVSQPEVHVITVESAQSVVLVDSETNTFEVIPRTLEAKRGGAR
jgi:hypothetical protein